MKSGQKKYRNDLWQKEKPNQEKAELESILKKIQSRLKSDNEAKKAALIIETMLSIKKKS